MDCPIKKILSIKSVVTKSKHICEIETFVKSKPIFMSQIPIFEFDSEWEVEIITQYSFEFYFNFQINLNETIELENLQFQVSVGSGSIRIVDSGFSEVNERVLTCKVGVEKKTLLNLVSKEGRLTIELQVELKYSPDPISFLKQLCSKNTKLQLADQYSSLLNDETYSDFTFIVQGKSFKVHKNILANVSETMRTMFASQLKETMKGECHVEDIEPSVFQNMLQFIYAGIIPANLEDVSFALYKAAHYYRIVKLLEICKEDIHFRLNSCNAQEVYEFATIYEMEDVKMDAWKIVKTRYFKIFFPLHNEPLPLEDFKEIRDLRRREKEIWSKHKKTNLANPLSIK